ncbi:MAG: class I SAM-dependent methyltransferase [Candidatus Acidiferrales bacterium]
MKTYIRSKLDSYFDSFARKADLDSFARKADLDNLYAQLAAFTEIKEIVGPRVPVGPFREWAISPDALVVVLRDLISRTAPKVVEFGSGESTIAIAATLRSGGQGSLLTIEHDGSFAKKVIERLNRHGLADHAEVRIVPMRDYESCMGLPRFTSYDLGGLEKDFDIALVDGPIVGQFGGPTRAVPVGWCVERLTKGRVTYLDDAYRSAEKDVIAAIKMCKPNLIAEFCDAEKGLCKFTMNQTSEAIAR